MMEVLLEALEVALYCPMNGSIVGIGTRIVTGGTGLDLTAEGSVRAAGSSVYFAFPPELSVASRNSIPLYSLPHGRQDSTSQRFTALLAPSHGDLIDHSLTNFPALAGLSAQELEVKCTLQSVPQSNKEQPKLFFFMTGHWGIWSASLWLLWMIWFYCRSTTAAGATNATANRGVPISALCGKYNSFDSCESGRQMTIWPS